jgi:hypothetical protein
LIRDRIWHYQHSADFQPLAHWQINPGKKAPTRLWNSGWADFKSCIFWLDFSSHLINCLKIEMPEKFILRQNTFAF